MVMGDKQMRRQMRLIGLPTTPTQDRCGLRGPDQGRQVVESTIMMNLPWVEGMTRRVVADLEEAGVDILAGPIRSSCGVVGYYLGWTFTWRWRGRWQYWVAETGSHPLGPDVTRQLWERHGHVVRVDGHAGGIRPGTWTDLYHVDTAEGLGELRAAIWLAHQPMATEGEVMAFRQALTGHHAGILMGEK